MIDLTFEQLVQHARHEVDANSTGTIPALLALVDTSKPDTETDDDE